MSFFLSWLFFAGLWYAIVYFHGDLEPQHLPDRQEDAGWKVIDRFGN
jgi:potassium inwardly-rectifying channel subfamily J